MTCPSISVSCAQGWRLTFCWPWRLTKCGNVSDGYSQHPPPHTLKEEKLYYLACLGRGLWLPPDMSRASIRRPGWTGLNEVVNQLPAMVTQSLVRSFPSLSSSLQGDGPKCRQWEVWRKIWGSSYVEKILGAGTQSFPLPCGDHPQAVCTEKGGEAAMCFYLGVGRSVV